VTEMTDAVCFWLLSFCSVWASTTFRTRSACSVRQRQLDAFVHGRRTNSLRSSCCTDIEFFRSNPRPFFAFAKELFPKSSGFTFVPSRSHYFLKLLEEKGKLLRIYSQNIDMLEHAAGISHERAVLCHGSFATATCLACKRTYPNDAIREDVLKQQVPMCQSCKSPDGIVKPDIVFFGESLPRRFHDSIKSDEGEADLVLVMGSSLKVNPVRSIVGRFNKDTPMILINREPVGRPHKFDVELLGYSDEIVQELCRLLGWEIPQPDPVILGQSNLPPPPVVSSSTVAPLSFEFVPPARHLFNGSKSTYCSSSDDDSSSSSSEDGTGGEGDLDAEAEAVAVAMDADDEKRAPPSDALPKDDQDELMGSGNELLGTSSIDDN
jgi:NAD-dependent deacetylase sirtuin 1